MRLFLTVTTYMMSFVHTNFADNVPGHIGDNTVLQLNDNYGEVYTTECNLYKYFAVYFFHPCYDLTISVLPSKGEPDLYVVKANNTSDPYPTKSTITWATNKDREYSLTISRWDTESAPGWYYIGVYNDCNGLNSAKAVYQIKAVKEPLNSYVMDTTQPDIMVFPDLGIDQQVNADKYKFFRFCIPRCSDVKVKLETCLDPKLCPKSYLMSDLIVSRTEEMPTISSYRLALSCL